METGFEVIKYINNPYALIAFIVIVIIVAIEKIRAGGRYKQEIKNISDKGGNQININGSNNKVSDIRQSMHGGDERDGF